LLLALPFVLMSAGPAGAADDYVVPATTKDHWAWKPPVRPPVPRVNDRTWLKSPIDAFVLERLEAAGITPAPPAPRDRLIRRVTFDLTGLPPTPEEIDAFVADPSPNAFEKVIDRLLASPQYGERWGRHWLDVVRFAESNGYEFDEPRPNAWRYRDYVISSFNQDKLYDRFIREQLAGDELYPDEPEALVATGFNLLGPDMTDSSDQAQRRQNTLNDMTDTAGLAFLGLTIGCARCHDHKFEPIPQTDYYRLQAFFTPAAFRRDLLVASRQQQAAFEAKHRTYTALTRPVSEELARLEEPYRRRLLDAKLAKLSDEARAAHRTPEDQRSGAQLELVEMTNRLVTVTPQEILKGMDPADRGEHRKLQDRLKEFDVHKPLPLPAAMGLRDGDANPPRTFLLTSGELSGRGEEVQPGFPIILSADHRPVPARIEPGPGTTGRRAALAGWIADAQNPLTARVLVNRLWQHHFGRGIVPTASDLGVRGEPPTHPELLDWLAAEFMGIEECGVRNAECGTEDNAPLRARHSALGTPHSIKAMHRMMLCSATYRQSAQASSDALAKDPSNKLFSRMNRLRLEGEIIRDSLLAIGGRLNVRMGGPGMFPPIPGEALKGSKGWAVSPDPRDHVRRSVYIFARRNLRFPFLEVFDLPDSNSSCPQRERSITAPQALALLNAEDVGVAAEAFAARLARETATPDERITRAFRLALGRPPSPTELQHSREFLAHSPLTELCRGLFNLTEMVYLD
jgi:hypothetical protein